MRYAVFDVFGLVISDYSVLLVVGMGIPVFHGNGDSNARDRAGNAWRPWATQTSHDDDVHCCLRG